MTSTYPEAPVATILASHDVVALDGDAPIIDAAKLMAERGIGSVAVRDAGEFVGLVTERDVVRALARGEDPARPMRDAMRRLPRVGAGTTEAACAAVMRDHATRHLLVEHGGRVLGVVSMTDIVQHMLDEKQFVIEQLETYICGI